MVVEEDYNDHVTLLRKQYQSEEEQTLLRGNGNNDGLQKNEKKSLYDEDIHYPVLLTLRLKKTK